MFLHPQSDDAMQLKLSNIAEYEKICEDYGIMVAGIPCGSDEYQLVVIDKFLEELQQEVNRFKEIDKSHAKWAVLKQSISKRIVHFQRGMTPEAIHKTNLINRYKNILRDMLGDIMKVSSEKIQDHSMAIAWLRTIDGGGGLQYHEDNTLPAYVASYTAALREIVKAYPIVREMVETEMRGEEWDTDRQRIPDKLSQYFNSIKTLTQIGSCIDGKAELVSLEGLWKLSEESDTMKGLQGRLSKYTNQYRLDKIRKDLSVLQPYNFNHVQVLTSSSGSEAACFLNMVPREGIQIKDNQQFANALRRRFQVAEPEFHAGQRCKCGVVVDPYTWHYQKCAKFAKGRLETHEQLKHTISHMLSTARIPHTLESIPFKEGHGQESENMKRLDIVVNHPTLLIPDTRRTHILLDQTVTHPTVNSRTIVGQIGGNHMEHATREARAANESENRKHNKYDQLACDHNMEMCPMGFEIQGKWGQSTNTMFTCITKRMNNINNASLLPKSLSTSYWRLKICLTLQIQVSKHILHAIYDQPFKNIHSTGTPQDPLFQDLYPSPISQASV